MFTRTSRLAACGAILGVLAAGASVNAWSNAHRLAYLTFSGPVGLPGVSLAAGTYAFEVANPDGGANVVLVRNKARTSVYFQGLADRIDRPSGIRADSRISFGEPGRGVPTPITAWYPSGGSAGYKFLYPKAR